MKGAEERCGVGEFRKVEDQTSSVLLQLPVILRPGDEAGAVWRAEGIHTYSYIWTII